MTNVTKNIIGSAFIFILLFLRPVNIMAEQPGEASSTLATALTTVKVASGLSNPVFVGAPADDDRLFIVEQSSGKILILHGDSILTTPFIDLGSKISTGGERGLLGLAFHPNYAVNSYFYVNYTRSGDGATVVSRFTVSSDPDIADASSEQIILTVAQPFGNHNAGMLTFGPNDGYLYIGMGDGGGGGDPLNNAQDMTSLLGKMLRIDVDGASPYGIPPDNPFVDSVSIPDEIWAVGLRNPWRYSFDRETGDLYIADVGQSLIEEVNFQSGTSQGGENYGWRCYEGNNTYNTADCGDSGEYDFPIYDYDHSNGECSVTGGYVYRGCAIPDLKGAYFFGDFCSGRIWSFRYDGASMSDFQNRTAELDPEGADAISMISSFGEDGQGELYVIDYADGEVYKIVPADVPSACSICGDANGNGTVNILDLTFIISYLYKGGPAPMPLETADVNSSGEINILDITYLIMFLYKGGSEPNCA